MANVPHYAGFDDVQHIYQVGLNRSQPNEELSVVPPTPGGGDTRPVAGQAWPRGNVRGNG
jgi:hypothetical protein